MPFSITPSGGSRIRAGASGRAIAARIAAAVPVSVCSPVLLRRLPLREPEELRHHTLLHAATLPGVWLHWLRAAGVPDLTPQASVTLEHFCLTLQAALDGLGVAMGPERLIADDVAAGRPTRPFAGPSLPARSDSASLPESGADRPTVRAFCAWLTEAADRS